MCKQEFLDRLREALSGLPQEDAAERLNFYGEMIDDRMEEGLAEEEAVAEIGPVGEIAAQIIGEIPLSRLVKERVRPKRRMQAWEILLLVLGSPLWLSLLLAFLAVVLSVYIVLWALILCLWAVELSFLAGALGGVAAGIVFFFRGEGLPGLAMFGAGFLLAGLSIFLFYGCRAARRGALQLTGKIARGLRSLFLRKERTK